MNKGDKPVRPSVTDILNGGSVNLISKQHRAEAREDLKKEMILIYERNLKNAIKNYDSEGMARAQDVIDTIKEL